MKNFGITCSPHYVPLHKRPIFHEWGRFSGEDVFTTAESDRLIRLPLYYGLSDQDQGVVIDRVWSFFKIRGDKEVFQYESGMEGAQKLHQTNGHTGGVDGATPTR